MDKQKLKNALEAILMVAPQPCELADLARAIEVDESTAHALVHEIKVEYADRGFALREVAGGWRIYSRPAYDDYVSRFLQGQKTATLSQAALETLAVIAYRQPVTRAAVAAIRGVNVDGVSRTLEAHGLIERVGTAPSGATMWGTTDDFLHSFGLNSLEQLPPLAPHLPDMEQLEDVIEKLEERSGGSAPTAR